MYTHHLWTGLLQKTTREKKKKCFRSYRHRNLSGEWAQSKKWLTWSFTWYRMKLRVDNRPDGTTQVRGKVWPTGEPEPAAWTIEKTDKIPHRNGSPGIYADGISDVYFDNIAVYPNK